MVLTDGADLRDFCWTCTGAGKLYMQLLNLLRVTSNQLAAGHRLHVCMIGDLESQQEHLGAHPQTSGLSRCFW